MSEPQLPPRPAPSRSVAGTLAAWWAWVGPGRLLLTAVSVAVVVGGAAWLVRPGAVPTEQGLPVAVGGAPTATLPIPTTPPVPTGSSPAAAAPTRVLVHVAGAVVSPGVYELPDGARVVDVVDAAGGAAPDADLDGLNLAAAVVDGERVYVPVAGEVDPATVPTGRAPGEPPADGGSSAGPVDLNQATTAQLEELPGVGPATAAAIVEDRERNGPFASVDDLDRVAGIGPAKLAALRDLVTV